MSEEPTAFSPAGAIRSIEQMFQAIPKSKRLIYIGNLNEALVVIERLSKRANVTQKEQVT